MKKSTFIFFIVFMSWTSVCFANSSGSAFIPQIYSGLESGYLSLTNIYVTNKTANTIDVKIALYGHLGNLLADTTTSSTSGIIRAVDTLTSYSETTQDYTVTYTLTPFQSAWIQLQPPSSPSYNFEYGYGKIEWNTTTNGVTAPLLAYGFARYFPSSGGGYQSAITINGGNPF